MAAQRTRAIARRTRTTAAAEKRPEVDPVLARLGDRVRQRRLDRGMRGEELSVATGIPFSTLYSIEAGRTDPGCLGLLSLSRALGCEPMDLLRG